MGSIRKNKIRRKTLKRKNLIKRTIRKKSNRRKRSTKKIKRTRKKQITRKRKKQITRKKSVRKNKSNQKGGGGKIVLPNPCFVAVLKEELDDVTGLKGSFPLTLKQFNSGYSFGSRIIGSWNKEHCRATFSELKPGVDTLEDGKYKFEMLMADPSAWVGEYTFENEMDLGTLVKAKYKPICRFSRTALIINGKLIAQLGENDTFSDSDVVSFEIDDGRAMINCTSEMRIPEMAQINSGKKKDVYVDTDSRLYFEVDGDQSDVKLYILKAPDRNLTSEDLISIKECASYSSDIPRLLDEAVDIRREYTALQKESLRLKQRFLKKLGILEYCKKIEIITNEELQAVAAAEKAAAAEKERLAVAAAEKAAAAEKERLAAAEAQKAAAEAKKAASEKAAADAAAAQKAAAAEAQKAAAEAKKVEEEKAKAEAAAAAEAKKAAAEAKKAAAEAKKAAPARTTEYLLKGLETKMKTKGGLGRPALVKHFRDKKEGISNNDYGAYDKFVLDTVNNNFIDETTTIEITDQEIESMVDEIIKNFTPGKPRQEEGPRSFKWGVETGNYLKK
jgi:hypothetical protein